MGLRSCLVLLVLTASLPTSSWAKRRPTRARSGAKAPTSASLEAQTAQALGALRGIARAPRTRQRRMIARFRRQIEPAARQASANAAHPLAASIAEAADVAERRRRSPRRRAYRAALALISALHQAYDGRLARLERMVQTLEAALEGPAPKPDRLSSRTLVPQRPDDQPAAQAMKKQALRAGKEVRDRHLRQLRARSRAQARALLRGRKIELPSPPAQGTGPVALLR